MFFICFFLSWCLIRGCEGCLKVVIFFVCTWVMEVNENLSFFIKLELEGKRRILDFCMDVGLIGSGYECPKCPLPMELMAFVVFLCSQNNGQPFW